MLSNVGRDVILRGTSQLTSLYSNSAVFGQTCAIREKLKLIHMSYSIGAPPAIGRIVPKRRPSLSSSGSSSSRSTFGSSASSINNSTSFLSSGLPSADRAYPVLALLEILRHTNQQHNIIDGLDILADSGSLAQILRYQREASTGVPSPISLSPSSSSGSAGGSLRHKSSENLTKTKSRTFSFNSSSGSSSRKQQKQKQQPQYHNTDQLSIHALLHGNTLVLLSDLSLPTSNRLEETPESRLKTALSNLTHSPLHGSHDHRRAIRYNAGGLSILTHFPAHASLAEYPPHAPFIPISHAPCGFPNSKIDYHVIPDAVHVPLEHELLVHCTFDEPEVDRALAMDEMTFSRVEKLMEIREIPRFKAKDPMIVKNLGVKSLKTDLSGAAALVAPFLRKLREELRETKYPLVRLTQMENYEILVVEDPEPLMALDLALKNFSSRS